MVKRSLATSSMTRQQFIRASGGALATASFVGAAMHRPAAAQSDGLTIPDPAVQLPEDDVTLRVATTPEGVAFWNAFADAYGEKHDNIAVEADALNVDDLRETLTLGIRNESAHDIFYYNLPASLRQAVGEGWLAPLDDLIPNFDEWVNAYPPGTFLEGVHVVDGKLYVYTATAPKRASNLLLFNRAVVQEAGYELSTTLDPSPVTISTDEYREIARSITEQGDGQMFGIIIETQPNRMHEWVTDLAYRAGRKSVGGIDPDTGEYAYVADEYVAAIEFLMALKSDGSFFPASPTRAQEAWARLPAGNAAMVTCGAWVVDTYNRDAPDFDFGVGVHPVMDKASALPQSYAPDATNHDYVVFSGSELLSVVGDTLSFLGSPAGQQAWADTIGGVGQPPLLPEAREYARDHTNEQGARALEITEVIVAAPSPIVRNPDISIYQEESQAVTPNLGEVIQAIFVGETADVRAALQDLKDRSEAEHDRAIAAAQERGAAVSREDWIFPNWDPTRDYTAEDYNAL